MTPKVDSYMAKLEPYGINPETARKLPRIPGIDELLEREKLPPNEQPTPRIMPPGPNIAPAKIGIAYRRVLADYLRHWLPDITPNSTRTVYEVLIRCCDQKSGKTK